jgi:hypothetical protein
MKSILCLACRNKPIIILSFRSVSITCYLRDNIKEKLERFYYSIILPELVLPQYTQAKPPIRKSFVETRVWLRNFRIVCVSCDRVKFCTFTWTEVLLYVLFAQKLCYGCQIPIRVTLQSAEQIYVLVFPEVKPIAYHSENFEDDCHPSFSFWMVLAQCLVFS